MLQSDLKREPEALQLWLIVLIKAAESLLLLLLWLLVPLNSLVKLEPLPKHDHSLSALANVQHDLRGRLSINVKIHRNFAIFINQF